MAKWLAVCSVTSSKTAPGNCDAIPQAQISHGTVMYTVTDLTGGVRLRFRVRVAVKVKDRVRVRDNVRVIVRQHMKTYCHAHVCLFSCLVFCTYPADWQ